MGPSMLMLQPAIALVLWSFVIWIWMYATRIPAIRRSGMVLDPTAGRGEQMALLPPRVRWKADNYNNLMEQPTLFYAVALMLAMIGDASNLSLGLAWAYVAVRIAHSLIQTLINKVEVRFGLFAIASLILLFLSCRAGQQILL